jgi:hypothetical protein
VELNVRHGAQGVDVFEGLVACERREVEDALLAVQGADCEFAFVFGDDFAAHALHHRVVDPPTGAVA